MKTKDIIQLLEDEIKNVQEGKTEVKKAKAIADLSSQIIYAMRLEREDARAKTDDKRLDLKRFEKGFK